MATFGSADGSHRVGHLDGQSQLTVSKGWKEIPPKPNWGADTRRKKIENEQQKHSVPSSTCLHEVLKLDFSSLLLGPI